LKRVGIDEQIEPLSHGEATLSMLTSDSGLASHAFAELANKPDLL
jgi:hypothetical protein